MGGGNLGIKPDPPLIHRLVGFVIQVGRLGRESIPTRRRPALRLAAPAGLNDGDNVDSLAKWVTGDVIQPGR